MLLSNHYICCRVGQWMNERTGFIVNEGCQNISPTTDIWKTAQSGETKLYQSIQSTRWSYNGSPTFEKKLLYSFNKSRFLTIMQE